MAKVKSVRQQVRDSITGQLLDKLGCEKLPRELEHQVKTYMGFYDRFGALEAAIADFDQVLSLNLLSAAKTLREKQTQEEQASADPEIDALVAARTEAKKAKNFAEADRIRDELKAKGIEIIDTPQGAKWRKV